MQFILEAQKLTEINFIMLVTFIIIHNSKLSCKPIQIQKF